MSTLTSDAYVACLCADQHVLPIPTPRPTAAASGRRRALQLACVESVFSGVKRLLGDFFQRMSPEVLELHVFIHYNFQYEFMRPSIEEIVNAYLEV